MAKRSNQKLKSLYIMKILYELTDEKHGISMRELMAELEKYDIYAERKSIYDDINHLIQYGIEIEKEKSKQACEYRIVNREFELVELRMLVDAVQSAKFISEEKSRSLIRKIGRLTSRYQARMLQRQVWIQDRVKTDNEKVYYAIDQIGEAIDEKREIQFRYCKWVIHQQAELKPVDKIYKIFPWQMVWEDGNYYLIGYDKSSAMIKHFRIDKMLEVSVVTDNSEKCDYFTKMNRAIYPRKHFKMFDGKESTVVLEFDNTLIGVVKDRFGSDAMIYPVDNKHFRVVVDVVISNPFWGWIVGLGDGVKVVGSAGVVEQFQTFIMGLHNRYVIDKKG